MNIFLFDQAISQIISPQIYRAKKSRKCYPKMLSEIEKKGTIWSVMFTVAAEKLLTGALEFCHDSGWAFGINRGDINHIS